MADAKITALTAKTTIELTDLIPLVDMTGIPTTKKMTVANFLVSLRIRQGETDSDTVLAGITKAFVFSAALGTAVDGSDYDLPLTCVDALNATEEIGYVITNRTQNGFEITPVADAYISFTAILI